MNKMLSEDFNSSFKPELQKIQQIEEARISFQKFVMDKFIQTLTCVGQTINFVTAQCLEENDAITT